MRVWTKKCQELSAPLLRRSLFCMSHRVLRPQQRHRRPISPAGMTPHPHFCGHAGYDLWRRRLVIRREGPAECRTAQSDRCQRAGCARLHGGRVQPDRQYSVHVPSVACEVCDQNAQKWADSDPGAGTAAVRHFVSSVENNVTLSAAPLCTAPVQFRLFRYASAGSVQIENRCYLAMSDPCRDSECYTLMRASLRAATACLFLPCRVPTSRCHTYVECRF